MNEKNWVLLIMAVMTMGLIIKAKKHYAIVKWEEVVVEAPPRDPLCVVIPIMSEEEDWSIFIDALAWVESGWNTKALGTKQDVGYLQLTPIMVEHANEILGTEYFTLDDRYFKEKSIEMFNVVMNERNPERDKHFALKIWNPKAPVSYHTKVMSKYYELLNGYYDENHSEN